MADQPTVDPSLPPPPPPPGSSAVDVQAEQPRKRKSRWEPAEEGGDGARKSRWADGDALPPPPPLSGVAGVGGVPDMDAIRAHLAARAGALVPVAAPGLSGSIESDDPEALRLHAQLVDVTARTHRGDLGPELAAIEEEGEPAPIYNSAGMRLNTREVLAKERQAKLRNDLIETLLKKCPTFRPPPDWRPPKRERKLYIPQKEFPGYNFFGLIIGPRGNTQKRLQRETNTRIAIRGKGSIKEGSSRDPKVDYAEWDELHVLITGDTDEDVTKAAELVNQLLRPVDDNANEHKRAQLRELALINGTLKEAEPCYLCGKVGHVQYDCPEKDITSYRAPKELVTCKICGDGGHPTIDCPQGRNGGKTMQPGGGQAAAQLQEEYRSFLSEVGLDADAPGGPFGGPLPPPPPGGGGGGGGSDRPGRPGLGAHGAPGGAGSAAQAVPVRDWPCTCGALNLAYREQCVQCGSLRPLEYAPPPPQQGAPMTGLPPAGGGSNAPLDPRKLYVGSLPHHWTVDHLRHYFGAFGDIVDATVIASGGVSKGYGFVKFMSPEQAGAAMANLHNANIEGRWIQVRIAGAPAAPRGGGPMMVGGMMGGAPHGMMMGGYPYGAHQQAVPMYGGVQAAPGYGAAPYDQMAYAAAVPAGQPPPPPGAPPAPPAGGYDPYAAGYAYGAYDPYAAAMPGQPLLHQPPPPPGEPVPPPPPPPPPADPAPPPPEMTPVQDPSSDAYAKFMALMG